MSTVNNTYLVDVICPVYNKASVIELFLKSFQNNLPSKYFNLILVNDGSTDETEYVVSKYLCDNISMLSKNNEGVSAARNKGLDLSKSKYIWFCDPDDEIIVDGIELINIIQGKDADLYVFSYMESNFTNKKSICYDFSKNECLTFEEYFLKYDYFSKKNGISTLWNKIFKRQIIGNTRFDKTLSNAEDRMFNINVLENNGTCLVDNVTIYNHIIYDSGTLSTARTEKKIENIKKVNEANIKALSCIKNDVTFENKFNIIILCKEILLLGKSDVNRFYFDQHQDKKISIFPLIKKSEFFYMMPKNACVFNFLRKIKRYIKC